MKLWVKLEYNINMTSVSLLKMILSWDNRHLNYLAHYLRSIKISSKVTLLLPH